MVMVMVRLLLLLYQITFSQRPGSIHRWDRSLHVQVARGSSYGRSQCGWCQRSRRPLLWSPTQGGYQTPEEIHRIVFFEHRQTFYMTWDCVYNNKLTITPGSRQVILGSLFSPRLTTSLPRLAGKSKPVMIMLNEFWYEVMMMVTNNMRPIAEANGVDIPKLESKFLFDHNHNSVITTIILLL